MKKALPILLLLIGSMAWAQIPKTLSFQGVLIDPNNGQAVADGSYTFIFSIYNVSTGGSTLWTETQSLTTSDGQYNAILGSVTPINISGSESYWLGVNVNTNELGRVKLTSAAYLLDDRIENLAATGNITGNAATVTTNANLTGMVTSVGNATSIANGVITDSKLATITTAGKVANSATTATNVNTANAIVARDASGNFSAGTITANLTGNASGTASNVTGIVAVANGGTGSATAATARNALGLSIGTNVQAYDADLDDLADGSLSGSKVGSGISWSNLTTGSDAQLRHGLNQALRLQYTANTGLDEWWLGQHSSNKSMSFYYPPTNVGFWIYTDGTYGASSDLRLKENIEDIKYGLQEILKLRPVSYNVINSDVQDPTFGLIAQEVRPIMKELIKEGDDEQHMLSLTYSEMIPVLIKAMQEQQAQIEELKNQVKMLTDSSESSTKISASKE